jgi:inosine-uridine nucleoside N-ribohydrolase
MVAALNSKSALQSSQYEASMELRGELTRGMMVLDQRVDTIKGSKRRNITVKEKLDTEILMDHLLRAYS